MEIKLKANKCGGAFVGHASGEVNGIKIRKEKRLMLNPVFRCIGIFLFFYYMTAVSSHALLKEEKNTIQVFKEASPAVVHITSVVVKYDLFFNPVPSEGMGSGIIIHSKGYILTNHHVIRNADKLNVTLADGSSCPGKIVKVFPRNDLAVIKIDPKNLVLKVLPLQDNISVEVGEKVLAIGNPFGLQQTLTTGIVSFVGRSVKFSPGLMLEDLIQTDCAINPGNSGGPLINSKGNLIGLNTAILSPTGAYSGVGFAIPVSQIHAMIPNVLESSGDQKIMLVFLIIFIILIYFLRKMIFHSRTDQRSP